MKFNRFLPILNWLPEYDRATFNADLTAGLTVGVMFVPQAMAYALLAGMPPIYGLYAGLLPTFLYGILGTSRQLSVGPVAISSLLVLAGVSQLALPESDAYVEYVILAGFFIGLTEITLSLLRFGFLVNFLSHPVITGFTMAASVIIAISQLKEFLGFSIPRFEYTYETVLFAIKHLEQTNLLSVMICLGAMLIMIVFRKMSRNIPGALIVVILFTVLCWMFQLDQYGLSVIGEIPRGLPSFKVPGIQWDKFVTLLPTILVVTTIGFVESISIAKTLEVRNRNYRVFPDQELLAYGVAKVVGSFFQSMPTSGSFSRSAVNDSAGGKTGVSSMITSLLVVLTLLFLTDLFYFTPNAVLAAIILLAVRRIFNYREAIYLWRTQKRDFWVLAATFFITLSAGIEVGVFSGVLVSLFIVLYRSSKPHFAVLGKIPGTTDYRNRIRHTDVEMIPELLIFRFDDQLYFANATYFKDKILEQIARRPVTKHLILECSNMHDLDSTGVNALEEIHHYLGEAGIGFSVANLTDRVEDIFERSGLSGSIGLENHFVNIHQAVERFQKDHSYVPHV